jgi:hypothetical protein
MALILADRVQETTTTTGTGTVTLAGASAGYQSFAAIGDGNTTYYTITSGNDWEVGIGTYTASGTTLARTTVFSSSAGGTTKITLSGTSNVFVTYPAEAVPSYVYTKTTFTATGGQTTFTVAYTVGYIDVYLNGVKLTTSEYTATNGTSVVLGTAAALNDIVETLAWSTFSATNTNIGVGTGTSLALTGTSANILAAGPAGATNPTLNIDASTASAATGLNVKSAAAAGGLAVSVLSSGTNENLTINAKGSGTITLNNTATGGITLSRALTYGGVTLSNAVTGTGNMVLSASPSLSGVLTVNGTTARSEFSVTAANTEAARFRSTSGSNAYGLSVAFDTVPNDTTRYFISCNSTAGTTYAIIYSNGNLANLNNSYGSTSDAKLKQDIVLAGSQWGDIKEIGKIVSKYRFKNNPNGPLQIGLVAQDLQAISPGLVNSSSDVDEETKQPLGTETLSVQYSVLYMKAVKALGEALERIETLESRVATLEGNQP